MTFCKMILSMIFLIIVFGKEYGIDSGTIYIGLCVLLASWIFGSAIEGIGDNIRRIRLGVESYINGYTSFLSKKLDENESERSENEGNN